MQVGDSLPHAAPLQTLGRTSLCGPVGKQALHGVDGLPGAQHIAPATVRLVVKFGGVAIHLVLDAYAFLAAFHVRSSVPLKFAGIYLRTGCPSCRSSASHPGWKS